MRWQKALNPCLGSCTRDVYPRAYCGWLEVLLNCVIHEKEGPSTVRGVGGLKSQGALAAPSMCIGERISIHKPQFCQRSSSPPFSGSCLVPCSFRTNALLIASCGCNKSELQPDDEPLTLLLPDLDSSRRILEHSIEELKL